MLVSDFLAKWLKDKSSTMGASRFANYAYNVKTDIAPYFEKHPIMLPELSTDALSAFFAYETRIRFPFKSFWSFTKPFW